MTPISLSVGVAGQARAAVEATRRGNHKRQCHARALKNEIKFNFPYKLLQHFLFKWKFVEKKSKKQQQEKLLATEI